MGTGKLQELNILSSELDSEVAELEQPVQIVFLYTGRKGSPENSCDFLRVTELICGNVRPTLPIPGPLLLCFPLFILVYSDSIKETGPASSCSLDIF